MPLGHDRHRPAQRHAHPADAGDASGDGRRTGRRRRLWRGPDRPRARGADGGPARQGGSALRAVGHDGQPARDPLPDGARRRGPAARGRAYRALRAGRLRAALRRLPAPAAGSRWYHRTGDRGRPGTPRQARGLRHLPAEPAPGAGEHAQCRRRHGLADGSAGCGGRHRPRDGDGAPPRWCPALERRGSARRRASGNRRSLRYGERLLLQGAGGTRRLGARRQLPS